MNKTKIALRVLRNSRARALIIKGLKNRRVRGLAWTVAMEASATRRASRRSTAGTKGAQAKVSAASGGACRD